MGGALYRGFTRRRGIMECDKRRTKHENRGECLFGREPSQQGKRKKVSDWRGNAKKREEKE